MTNEEKEILHEKIYALKAFTSMAETIIDTDENFKNEDLIKKIEVVLTTFLGMIVISVPFYAEHFESDANVNELINNVLLRQKVNLNG